jgi:DEAD/DEAH box helicase domain-containing protein
VLILSPDDIDLPGPAPTVTSERSAMPAGVPALWSFAELFRVAAALELDVNPNELESGLQPFPTEAGLMRRVFLADALENGAGYTTELGKPEVLERVFGRIFDEIAPSWEREAHSRACDVSCPDCLRSYENRRLHSVLDWRLALDLAELASGRELTLARWLGDSERLAKEFAAAFELEAFELPALWAAREPSTGRAAVFGHPLWRLDEAFFVDDQVDAIDAARGMPEVTAARAFDLYRLRRAPQEAFTWLVAS